MINVSAGELSRKVLGAPSAGRILRLDFASSAPGDGGWERFQRLSERSQATKEAQMPNLKILKVNAERRREMRPAAERLYRQHQDQVPQLIRRQTEPLVPLSTRKLKAATQVFFSFSSP